MTDAETTVAEMTTDGDGTTITDRRRAISTGVSTTVSDARAGGMEMLFAGLCGAAGLIHVAMVPAHAGIVEPIGAVDLVCAALEGMAVLVGGALAVAPRPRVSFTPILGGVAALAIATAVIASPEAGTHGAPETAATGASTSGGGHSHGGAAATSNHLAEMALIDDTRCDLAVNPAAYWSEAATLGVDTYTGGTMDMQSITGSDSVAAAVATPDPFGGRGTPTLDRLIALTSKSSGGEGAAAGLVVKLSEATDEEYRAWLGWLRTTTSASHSHASGGGDDQGGHGGHVGPQPWKAMVDRSDCDRLADELSVAQETALKYPTVADAEAAGWTKVTGYVPGIASHYMNFGLVDGTFELERPEMILYDGTAPNSRVVGLSYYLIHEGDFEPTQSFTGGNDHFHRHIGLCLQNGVVIGDSTLTPDQCAARGGNKSTGSSAWMSHAWVVPGCESPWGVFSAASPLLDRKLTEGTGSIGCAASGVSGRYDLSPGSRPSTSDTEELASGPGGR